MASIEPIGTSLGATIRGIDLAEPLSDHDRGIVVLALGRYGLVRFPDQRLEARHLAAFAARFGEVQIARGRASKFVEPGLPEVSILSNIVENGQPIGSVDIGALWHTDMIYNSVPGFANVLYALEVPYREGQARGDTLFADLQLAYDSLPDGAKAKLEGVRGVYTGEEYGGQSAGVPVSKPRLYHPLVMKHPISGRKVLYCDPMHIASVEGCPDGEGEAMARFLRDYVVEPRFQFAFRWARYDVLIWDNLRTLHRAVSDYSADEHRLIKRCQVLGDKVFDPDFIRSAQFAAAA
ncbi:MAG TPA: TauD/TfdA family dioxygenase [Beijerinckiaceae bacterium]|nr:TauD/TfdA family dioxygenase [Beijerinckiaceae bacterium]